LPLIDLISPWAHAAASLDAREVRSFRARHAVLLETIRQQRTPLLAELPAPGDWRVAAARAVDDELLEAIRGTRDRMVEAGFRAPGQIVLVASGAPGQIAEVIPGSASLVGLFLDRDLAEAVPAALAGAIAIHHRWSEPSRSNPIARIAAQGPWDKWQVAREVALAEWIYATGIGVHAGATSATSSELRRLRAMERDLQDHLDAELDATGAGVLMRWLDDDAPPAMRRCADGFVVPRGAGRYLGWRMLEERVARVGVREAAVMAA
jgi:hypothetical protein